MGNTDAGFFYEAGHTFGSQSEAIHSIYRGKNEDDPFLDDLVIYYQSDEDYGYLYKGVHDATYNELLLADSAGRAVRAFTSTIGRSNGVVWRNDLRFDARAATVGEQPRAVVDETVTEVTDDVPAEAVAAGPPVYLVSFAAQYVEASSFSEVESLFADADVEIDTITRLG